MRCPVERRSRVIGGKVAEQRSRSATNSEKTYAVSLRRKLDSGTSLGEEHEEKAVQESDDQEEATTPHPGAGAADAGLGL